MLQAFHGVSKPWQSVVTVPAALLSQTLHMLFIKLSTSSNATGVAV